MIDQPDHRRCVCLACLAAALLALPGRAAAQLDFDREPIAYASAPVDDPVARLQRRIDAGEVQLQFDEKHGYLQSVLKELGVSNKSQMLVFSKTSFQQRLISPWSARSLYFNDAVYVGCVPGGEVVELSAVDPRQGAIFYTLAQHETDHPRFIRDRGNCLTCHASSRTQGVPGQLVRSVYPSPSGLPHFGAGTFTNNHTSPLKERWGGWYVTGTHGAQRHMGNVVCEDPERPEQLDREAGANVTDLTKITRVDPYLTPHSDIVALLVLEHQADMHNLITRANYDARLALRDAAIMNKALERPEGYLSESTQRRLHNASEKLLEYLLFSEEARLTDPVQGTSGFAAEFAAAGPFDSRGRSLRQFDLKTRLFKYPCSYLIYSEAFDALPVQIKDHVYARLDEVLSGEDESKPFEHLSAEDRQAMREILLETKPDLAAHWKA